MEPTVAHGEAATERSDVYAVGSLLQAALTGRAHFDAQATPDFGQAHRIIVPRDPDVAAAPAQLARIMAKALAREPGNRYATAGEMRADVAAARAALQASA